MRSAVASMAAAICGSRSATAAGTVASSPFMIRAISRVDCRSISASSGRNASVVRVASCARSSPYVSVGPVEPVGPVVSVFASVVEVMGCGSAFSVFGLERVRVVRGPFRGGQRVRGLWRWARAS